MIHSCENTMPVEWAIIAGGKGTRVPEWSQKNPKALLSVGEKTILENQIEVLIFAGVRKFHLLLGHFSELIIDYVQNLNFCECIEINYEIEANPLGTGGALVRFIQDSTKVLGVSHGDLYINTDIHEFVGSVMNRDCDWGQIVHPSNHVFDSDVVILDSENRILDFRIKPHSQTEYFRNRTNAGVYLFKPKALKAIQNQALIPGECLDLDRELLPNLLSVGLSGIGYDDLGVCLDVGTPERISKFNRLSRSRYFGASIRPTVFLDRDGVINVDSGWISSMDDFCIFPGVASSIARLNELGVRVIVITNQPVVARGELSVEGLNSLHNFMESTLAKDGAYVDDIFSCIHHTDSGFPGEISSLKFDCECRKPKTGLFQIAMKKYNIDLSMTFLVGDSWRDSKAAQSLGIRFFPVGTYTPLNHPDEMGVEFVYPNMGIAVDEILKLLKLN